MDLNWLHPEPLRFKKNVSINLTGFLPCKALPIIQMKHQVSQKTNIHLKLSKEEETGWWLFFFLECANALKVLLCLPIPVPLQLLSKLRKHWPAFHRFSPYFIIMIVTRKTSKFATSVHFYIYACIKYACVFKGTWH